MQTKIQEIGHNIPIEWTQLYAWVVQDYLLNSKEGKQYIVDLFNFEWKNGESDHEYQIADTNLTFPGDQIYFLNAVVVDGHFVPPTHVDEYQLITDRCESCGAFVHCGKDVNEKLICNHCLYHSDDHALSDGRRRCELCTVTKCPNHPLKINLN